MIISVEVVGLYPRSEGWGTVLSGLASRVSEGLVAAEVPVPQMRLAELSSAPYEDPGASDGVIRYVARFELVQRSEKIREEGEDGD